MSHERWSRRLQRQIGDQIGLPSDLPGTRDLSAYEYYLLGTQRRFGRTRLDLTDGAAYFRKAIERDAKFVAAYTGLGRCYLGEFYYAGRALDETRSLVMPLVEQALKLDPGQRRRVRVARPAAARSWRFCGRRGKT